MAELATGSSNDVMRKRFIRRAPNTACYLLIDGSISMSEQDGGVSRMRNALLAATAFSATLEACGYANAVGVFHDSGCRIQDYMRDSGIESKTLMWQVVRSGIRQEGAFVYVVKSWQQKFLSRLPFYAKASIDHYGMTPMGEAIMLAGGNLAERPEKRKVLMVFTDGWANGHIDTGWAIKECEKAELQVVLIGIAVDYVLGLHHRSVVVRDISKLATTTMKELGIALGRKV